MTKKNLRKKSHEEESSFSDEELENETIKIKSKDYFQTIY